MQTGKATVRSMFDGAKVFNIPIYQRAYAWEPDDNLNDFLTDLLVQKIGQPYFLGSFLLHIREQKGDYTYIDVVDGQQRITTFCIFINVLILELARHKSSIAGKLARRTFVQDDDVFKIDTENEDSSFIHNTILANPALASQPETKSQRLLQSAKDFFEKKLASMDKATLEHIYIVSTSAEVLLYVVDRIEKATQIFELLNDRGRRLTDLEAIKSYMMYNAGLVSGNANQSITDIQKDFGAIYRLSEKHAMPEQDILRYHNIAFEACPDSMREHPKAFLKQQISEAFRNNPDVCLQSIKNLSSRIRRSYELFGNIQERKMSNRNLSTIFMIGRIAPFYPLMMKALSESDEKFEELLKYLVRFTFRASLVGLRSNGESYLYTAIRNNEDYIALLKEFVENNWWDINRRAFDAAKAENYYEWLSNNLVRFILVEYENSLRGKNGFPPIGFNEYFTKREREKLSIEHISAQNAKGIEYDAEFEERYKHSIGNLVIDCAASNSSKGNKNTGDKAISYSKAPMMSQNAILNEDVRWDSLDEVKEFIRKREALLHEFVMKHFGIENYIGSGLNI